MIEECSAIKRITIKIKTFSSFVSRKAKVRFIHDRHRYSIWIDTKTIANINVLGQKVHDIRHLKTYIPSIF